MRLTRHNGRAGKNGVYNPKHNDRKFDVEHSEHIDAEKTKDNIYWDYCRGFSSPIIKRDDDGNDITFQDIELAYYFEHYQDHIDAQNERNERSRHTERNRTVEDMLKNKKTCPEETIYQIGTMDEHVSGAVLTEIAIEFFTEIEKKFGANVHILDWALHLDEKTPHIQERHVFDCKNNYGELCPQQEKALEELGIPLPDPTMKRNKINNRKVTYDAECRKMLFAICEKHGLHLEEEPAYGGRGYLEKQDYIIQKQKNVLEAQQNEISKNSRAIKRQDELITEKREAIMEKHEALKAVTMKLADMETLVDEVAEQAYEKACEVVKETVQEETKQADMKTVEEYRDWLSSPERTADKKLRDYVVKHLGRLLEVLKTGTEKLTKKITEKLQEPEKKAANLEQVKTAARSSLKGKLGERMKDVEAYKEQYYGISNQKTKWNEQTISR